VDLWATEIERWLEHVDGTGALTRFLPVLRGPQAQCESGLAEISTAYFLERRCGLPIIKWEPVGAGNRRGEFLVRLQSGGSMFVEVKSPGWEQEIAQEQGQNSPRLNRPKHIQGEARATAPWASVRHAVAKAYPKMPDHLSTLLIINDDLMGSLVDLLATVDIALYCPRAQGHTIGYLADDGCFATSQFERLGAVGIFQVQFPDTAPRYRFDLFENPRALATVAVPPSTFLNHRRHHGARPTVDSQASGRTPR